MASIMIADFSGMNPLRDNLLLPDNNAQNAINAWLYRGQVRGFRHSTQVYTAAYADTQLVYRIPKDITKPPDFTTNGSYWLEYPDPYMTTIRNPTVGDTWDRYYFFPSDQYDSTGVNPIWPATSPGPMYNTLSRIAANQTGYKLGVPAPTGGAPNVAPPPVTNTQETRAYVYTYVSAYNEEGPPSPATVKSGESTGTWVITIPMPVNADIQGRNLTNYRLYRTVTNTSGNATYYQVTQVPINFSGSTTINDSAVDSAITANNVLSSLGYIPPPPGLQGVVMMANGIAAGFTNEREVWFSDAYLPHAWPAAYALTVDYPIVGLTADGSSLNIMTQGSPFVATGVTPDTMTIGKITANEPCISRGSIVSSGEGAYYASPNGIILLNSGGTTNVSAIAWEKEFHYSLDPPAWAAGRYANAYMAAVKGPITPTSNYGFVFSIPDLNTDPNVEFSYLTFPYLSTNIYSDEISGQLFILNAAGMVVQWNPPVGDPGTTTLWSWLWKTKQFRFPFPQEFKAFMILFEVPPEVQIALGPRNTDQGQVFDQNTQYLIIRVYADGNPIVVREIQTSGEVLLIPGGFKATIWEFQMEGQIGMKFFKCASSVKELKAS